MSTTTYGATPPAAERGTRSRKGKDLQREFAEKMRALNERAREVTDGLRSGEIALDDFAD